MAFSVNRSVSPRSPLAVALVAASVVAASVAVAPAHAAPWAKSGAFAGSGMVEEVNWRGRRNTAIVAGAVGLGVLGLAAAAAASQPRGGYYGGYAPGYGYGPAYGYGPGYVEQRHYAPPRQVYGSGYGPVYGYTERYDEPVPVYRPRHRYNPAAPQSFQYDGRGRPLRVQDRAANN